MRGRGKRYHAVAAALWLPIFLLTSCGDAEPVKTESAPRPVKAVRVGDFEEIGKRWFSGKAKGTREISLSFRVPGQLIDFPVVVGDEVAEGDIVARLDPAPYKAEVDRIAANLSRAQATLENAEQQYGRDKQLFDKGHVAQARLDIRTAEVKKAQAEVASYKAQLDRAKLDLGYTDLPAPFSGRVVATYADNYEEVRAQQPILRVVDTSRIEMTVDIPESLISLVPEVKGVNVVFDAFPDLTIPAEIKEIGTEASEATRTYPVTLIMDQPEGATILPGMAGKATGEGPAARAAEATKVQIPVSATFNAGEGAETSVWVVDEASKTVSRRVVRIGNLTDFGVEVTEGLQPGEWVVTAGVSAIKDGQQVRLLEN